MLLQEVLQREEVDAYKHTQSNYYASLPLWVNSDKLPDAPEPPDWLADLIED